MRRTRRLVCASGLLLTLLLPVACSSVTVGSVPTTGPLYLPGFAFHTCTASVVSSPTRDLVITAAHCVVGTGAGVTFVPGSVNGSAPHGRWTVTATYVDPAWTSRQDPLHDVAFLRVAPQRVGGALRHVEDLTGGNRLIATPKTIGKFSLPAYLMGVGGSPITCLTTAHRMGAYSTFDCDGYSDGVSGAPWIQGSTVLGIIGGLHQGGCSAATSYSSPFDATTLATYRRAVTKARGDFLPPPGSDGC